MENSPADHKLPYLPASMQSASENMTVLGSSWIVTLIFDVVHPSSFSPLLGTKGKWIWETRLGREEPGVKWGEEKVSWASQRSGIFHSWYVRRFSMGQEGENKGLIVWFCQNGREWWGGVRKKKVKEVGCPGERSEVEDGDLLSPQISSLDQLQYGEILGNFSTDNANRKESLMVSQALCWALYHTYSFNGSHNSGAASHISLILQMKKLKLRETRKLYQSHTASKW